MVVYSLLDPCAFCNTIKSFLSNDHHEEPNDPDNTELAAIGS